MRQLAGICTWETSLFSLSYRTFNRIGLGYLMSNMENQMLDYSIMRPVGILVLKPHAPLGKADFVGLGAAVDSYLADHLKLRGVLIHAREFPGWEDFSGFAAHLYFVHEHHKRVERVAIVTDCRVGGLMESLAKHFTSAAIQHFPFADDLAALNWLGEA